MVSNVDLHPYSEVLRLLSTALPPESPIYVLYPTPHSVSIHDVAVTVPPPVAAAVSDEQLLEYTPCTTPAEAALRGAAYACIVLDSTWKLTREMAAAILPTLPARAKLVQLPPSVEPFARAGEEVPRVSTPAEGGYLRVEPSEGCLLTAEAVAHTMCALER